MTGSSQWPPGKRDLGISRYGLSKQNFRILPGDINEKNNILVGALCEVVLDLED